MADDERLSRLEYEARVYQSQLSQMRQQANSAQAAIIELDATIAGLSALGQAAGDTMMGLGSGAFSKASLTDRENVLLEVGAGVFVEMRAEDASKILQGRKKNLETALSRLAESAGAVNSRLAALEEKAAALSQG